jgi:protein-S-isoprenylcysteine O-methyltransferase Ste14
MFLGTTAGAIAFLGNFGFERTMDSAPQTSIGWALLVNVALLTVFAVQHSVMARPAFKRWWTRFLPQSVERSTYVLFSNLAILLLFWQWQPIGGTVWHVADPTLRAAIYALYGVGWIGLVAATCMIDHFELFGVRQVYHNLRGLAPVEPRFKTPGAYRFVRHPIYVAWLTIFWAAPTMTSAHLLFAVATTAYIFIAVRLEERDLETVFGEHYASYRRTVPMLIPRVLDKTRQAASTPQSAN